jgi:hypothetical protein
VNTRLALIILASTVSSVGSVLGMWWFLIKPSRYKSQTGSKRAKKSVLLTTLVITGVLLLIASLSGDWKPSAGYTGNYTGRVLDDEARPIASAKVIIDGFNLWSVAETDPQGRFSFAIINAPWTESVHMTVRAEGYRSYERNVSLSRTNSQDIHLTKLTPNPDVCPKIEITCGDSGERFRWGERGKAGVLVFKARVIGSVDVSPTYKWVTSSFGTIDGEGTDSIRFTTPSATGTVTANVEVGGFSVKCGKLVASCSATFEK